MLCVLKHMHRFNLINWKSPSGAWDVDSGAAVSWTVSGVFCNSYLHLSQVLLKDTVLCWLPRIVTAAVIVLWSCSVIFYTMLFGMSEKKKPRVLKCEPLEDLLCPLNRIRREQTSERFTMLYLAACLLQREIREPTPSSEGLGDKTDLVSVSLSSLFTVTSLFLLEYNH